MLERVGPIVVSVLVVVALVLVFGGDDPEPPPDPSQVEPFLDAYERSRSVESVVESVFTRTTAEGRELSYDQRVVQRPPDDRLVIGAGTAVGRIGGRIVRCNTDASGGPACEQGGRAVPYAEEVAAEIDRLAQWVAPDTGAYDVVLDEECFRLDLVVAMFSPPYGIEARFCFDDDTGVLREVVVERPEGTDHTVAVDIRTEVTAEDLRAADLGDPVSTG
jgi:hypothetical protein